jgi:hypothetical protein
LFQRETLDELFLRGLLVGVRFGGTADTLAVAPVDAICVGVARSSQLLEVKLVLRVEGSTPACFLSSLEFLLISLS